MPINQLQHEHQQKIAEQADVIELRIGDELLASQEQAWFLYLLEGKLDLMEPGQQAEVLLSSNSRANHPLFSEKAHKSYLLAQTNCHIIRCSKQLFYATQDEEVLLTDVPDSSQVNENEGLLFNEISHAFDMGVLKLPSLPDIANKVRLSLKHPSVDAEKIARIVSVDPAMSIRLISVANGPLKRGVEPIDTIQAAIVRLGMQTSKELIMSFAVKQLFTTRSKILSQYMHELYDRSVHVAAISFSLSKKSGLLSPDHLLFAGLLHEIGVIPLLGYIEDTGYAITNMDELNSVISRFRTVVGSMVIRHWGLSDDLIDVVENYEGWQRLSADKVDTCDLVIVAQLYNRLKHHDIEGLPRIDQVPALKKLFPDKQDAAFAGEVLEQAQQEIDEMMSLLKM